MNHWLIKSEPATYSFDQLLSDKATVWDGVRNYQARNNLKEMQKGDQILYYHSGEGKEIVGIAKVSKTHFQDPGTDDSNWVAIEVTAVKKLKHPVTLASIKSQKTLSNIGLIKQMRLSVVKILPEEFDVIIEMSNK